MTQSTEQERAEFEARFKHLDLTREPDAWGAPRYKHDAISLAWDAWQAARRAQVAKGNHVTFQAQGGETAPVQMPEPVAWMYSFTHSSATGKPDMLVDSISTDKRRAFASGHSRQAGVYTEHQVRQLLAAHGIQEQST